MNKLLNTFLITSILLIFSNCQKEVSSSNRPTTPTTPDDSTLLVKYYEVDSVPGEQPDTSLIVKFTYDAARRLTQDYVVFSTDPADNVNLFELDQYFYNNTDTLPYKYIYYSIEGVNPDNTFIDTFFYTYNTAGNVIADSILTYNGTNPLYAWKNQYDYQTDYIIRTTTDTVIRVDTVNQTFQNSNLTRQVNTKYDPYNGTKMYDFTYSYDNHPNPFCIPAYAKTRFIADFEDDSYSTPQKNNPLSEAQSYTYSGVTSANIIQYTYAYKANGYPSVVYIVYSGTNGNETRYVKGIFEYSSR